MSSLNYVGSLTIAAGATVGVFTGTSQTAAAANLTLANVPDNGGLVQVNSSAGTGASIPLQNGTIQVGGAEVYLKNTTSASITFQVRIHSLS